MLQPIVRTILCPVDFSPQSQSVVDHAIRVGELFGSKIIAINVVDDSAPEYATYRRSEKDMQTLRRTLEQDSHNRLNLQIVPKLRGMPSEMVTTFGKPADTIVQNAKKFHVGMIMMSTRSMGITNQFILGSTTYRIIRTAPCPLMVFSKPEQKFRPVRILFPTDFSELAALSLPFVFKFAKEYNSDVHFVHYRQAHISNVAAKDPKRELDALKRQAVLQGIERVFLNDDVKGVTPGLSIVKYAKEQNIDLTILSAHGMGGFKQFFLGSTAVEVSSRSECPVLVVRKPE